MRAIIIFAALLAAGAARADEARSVFDRSATVNGLVVVPSEPGASVHRFGNGVIIQRLGQPSQTVSPFGRGVIVNETGKPSITCSRFGRGTVCR